MPATHGIDGYYYFMEGGHPSLAFKRRDANLYFNDMSPDNMLGPLHTKYRVVWKGYSEVPKAGICEFSTYTRGGDLRITVTGRP